MTRQLLEDMHVHSTFSDGKDTPARNVVTAELRGLARLGCVDHVRRDTEWLPEFVRTIETLRPHTPVELFIGVEAKILSGNGNLDLPDVLDGVDLIFAADHQFPLPDRCAQPREIRDMLRDGNVSGHDLIEQLTSATVGTLHRYERIVLAHLFSIVRKVGLSEQDIPQEFIDEIAEAASQTGGMVEIDERWRCPSVRTISIFQERKVPVLMSTDSHQAQDIGRYEYVRSVLSESEWAE